ncbi:hypothetical protein [Paraglaciecola arctica]|uniref:RND efflux pump membrane fusion protein barrel-sandwich domain-containing protein n=1 Tax=Paraglaciecola arctica BSs20135 TaxID=493475 RepID=K6XFD2_9ALTE|nr:hypothetical protein [Paraglaciecola arctica]GAC19324.1 hypothetical protein GARC_2358 [Paraglaciecola arctica BSs20135]
MSLKSYLFISFSLLIFKSASASELKINVATLGDLELSTEVVQMVEHYPGNQLKAKVEVMPGRSFTLKSPADVQQTEYLVSQGQTLKKNQPFAIIRGAEVFHYYTEYQIKKSLYTLVESQFKSNRALYSQKVIDEQRWIDITQAYYAAQLAYEEYEHFFEHLIEVDEKQDAITLGSPIEGIFLKGSELNINAGDNIAQFVPKAAIRLKVAVPSNKANNLSYLTYSNCKLEVAQIESVSSGAYVTAWSTPLPEKCTWRIGEEVTAMPFYTEIAYRIPKSAVFSWDAAQYVFVKQDTVLISLQVNLLSSDAGYYIAQIQQADASVTEGTIEVLVSSVSAVQGVLLGLGSE